MSIAYSLWRLIGTCTSKGWFTIWRWRCEHCGRKYFFTSFQFLMFLDNLISWTLTNAGKVALKFELESTPDTCDTMLAPVNPPWVSLHSTSCWVYTHYNVNMWERSHVLCMCRIANKLCPIMANCVTFEVAIFVLPSLNQQRTDTLT